jgi:hypothetical protein
MRRLGIGFYIAAVVAGLGSIACFIIGMLGVRSAIGHLMGDAPVLAVVPLQGLFPLGVCVCGT